MAISGDCNLQLGNLDAIRDWGFAGDYVDAMWRMLQHTSPEDYVIATGRGCSVREFVTMAFQSISIELEWQGKGLDEIGVNHDTGKELISINPKFFRPTEVECLIGDASKAGRELGWHPSTTLESLVDMMVQNDIRETTRA
jgi:GDPmannose 4,6-dehydratase